ncbi:MAG: CIA30 family protein [Fuerstiella sp.]
MSSRFLLLFFPFITTMGMADDTSENRLLFTFSEADSARQWQTVNDGVMGGRSEGRFRINSENRLEFFGNLSLANNGGFASVRSRAAALNLRAGDSIVMKVRGDGREYTLNLYTPRRRTAFSYRAAFQTKKDEWTEITVPLSQFVATSFGRVVQNSPLQPGEVSSIGILLGDKKPGPFRLEIQSVGVRSAAR